MTKNDQLTFAILGCGGRGGAFSEILHQHPELGSVVAIAEPDPVRRKKTAELHKLPTDRVFTTWEDLVAKPKLADVMINTTMDQLHAPSSVPALNKGYHMLLEKPMATTLEDCVAIDSARAKNNRIVSICHSLRYNNTYAEIKRLLKEGAIGQIVSVDQLEGGEHTHQSHSFVRGNWGNQGRSTFMLMAKSCHDLDIIAYLVDKPCLRVSSFGALSYFRKENAPAGAPKRCTDGCPVEATCPYSTYKLYVAADDKAWFPSAAGMTGKTYEEKIEILKTGPYGRCVFHCDNDVVDHQVVNFEFENQITGTFTMTAFTQLGGRHIRIHGTHGHLKASPESGSIDIWRFSDGRHDHIEMSKLTGSHGGGDLRTLQNIVRAIRANDPNAVLTTTTESLASHKIVFAAEKSRLEKRVVELSELQKASSKG
jgi:predicted dehydrogenase